MKSALTLIGSFVMILVAVVCTVGAVISAFSFTVDAALLFFIWFFVALALAATAMIWRGKGILLMALPVLALFSWQLTEIAEGAKWVVFYISREFNKWLIWPVFFSGANESVYELTVFFAAAGVILAFLLAAAICLRRSAFLTVFLTVPIVFLTFILIHSQPDYRFLTGLLAVYLTLLISNSLYGDDFQKRGTAILPSLAIALALLGVAYLIAPPKEYKRELRMESIDFQLRNIASRIGIAQVKHGVGWPLAALDEWGFNTNNVEISNAGTRAIWDRTILEVTATEPGTFYLRGFSMRYFDGEQWTANSAMAPFPDEATSMDLPYFLAGDYMFLSYHPDYDPIDIKVVYMTVDKIRDATEDIVYAPYFSLRNNSGADGQNGVFIYTGESILKIMEKTRQILYTNSSVPSTSSSSGFSASLNGDAMLARYGKQSREAYTQVDGHTAEGLRMLADEAGIDASASREDVVDQVAQYIRSSGRYTLSPYVIPNNEDFALYFLKESKQGYCIHFATAATLMLRALGIPARFTSGFTVTVPQDSAGEPFPVTDRNAHAWVEVYYDEAGWLPLEVTPAAAGSGIPDARPHSPAAPAAPERDADAPDRTVDRDWADAPPPEEAAGDEAAGEADESPDARDRLRAMRDAIALIFTACAAACAIALMLRRPVARLRRKRQFEQEDANAAVICAWRYVTRLKGKDAPPKEIEELALKARFSQHTISGEERAKMVSYASTLALETYYSSKPLAKLALYLRGI